MRPKIVMIAIVPMIQNVARPGGGNVDLTHHERSTDQRISQRPLNCVGHCPVSYDKQCAIKEAARSRKWRSSAVNAFTFSLSAFNTPTTSFFSLIMGTISSDRLV